MQSKIDKRPGRTNDDQVVPPATPLILIKLIAADRGKRAMIVKPVAIAFS